MPKNDPRAFGAAWSTKWASYDSLSSPKWYCYKIKSNASKIVYRRMQEFGLDRIGLPSEVMTLHGNDQTLQTDLRNVIVLYHSSCIVFLDEYFFRSKGSHHQDYEK